MNARTLFAALVLLGIMVGWAAAIEIEGGPSWDPPGFGASATNYGTHPTRPTTEIGRPSGLYFEYTGLDLGETMELWHGTKVAQGDSTGAWPLFASTDGATMSANEIFRYYSYGGNQIIYMADSWVRRAYSDSGRYSDTRLVATYTGVGGSGTMPGTFVRDASTQALNDADNGDVEVLFHATGDFRVTYRMEVRNPWGGTWMPVYDFGDTYNLVPGQVAVSIDDGFYWKELYIPGDATHSGRVDSADLDIIRDHWNEEVDPGDLSAGDVSGDGYVGSADLDLVRLNWLKTRPLPPAAVPEPTTGLLLLAFAMTTALWRRS